MPERTPTNDGWSPVRTIAAGLAALAAVLAMAVATAPEAAASEPPARGAHAFSFVSIDGEPIDLADFAGRPMVVVNTASRCGFTPQYDGLQALWEAYRDRGLVLIGAPSNAFNQELASEDAVKEFCEVNFSLDFPMTEIVEVRGANAHPFFAWAGAEAGPPEWNFYKYVIDGEGRIVDAFPSSVRPMSAKMLASVERAFAR